MCGQEQQVQDSDSLPSDGSLLQEVALKLFAVRMAVTCLRSKHLTLRQAIGFTTAAAMSKPATRWVASYRQYRQNEQTAAREQLPAPEAAGVATPGAEAARPGATVAAAGAAGLGATPSLSSAVSAPELGGSVGTGGTPAHPNTSLVPSLHCRPRRSSGWGRQCRDGRHASTPKHIVSA